MGHKHIEKKCGRCQLLKPVAEFYAGSRGCRDGFCKACRRIMDRVRSSAKWARKDPDARRDYKLRKIYGITLAEYDAMAEAQGYCCAICRGEETRRAYGEKPRLVVDHDHFTGKVRQLLCAACNGRLGAVEDEQFSLRAREYLFKHGVQFMEGPPSWGYQAS